MKRNAFYLLLALALGAAAGTALYHQHRAQRQLNAQLQEMSDLLMTDNVEADQFTQNTIKGIHAAVQKNQNQPRELAVEAAAERLEQCTDSVMRTLRARTEELLPATRNVSTLPMLPHPDETKAVTEVLGNETPAYQHLRQQLEALTDTLRVLHPKTQGQLAAPTFEGQTVAVALATCAELESEVRAAEAEVLSHLATRVGARRLSQRCMALVSAESNVVALGELYRARLLLLDVLGPTSMQMHCNGQPVSVDSSSVGQVRFRAPLKPGPATWTGSIHFNQNGRDTTFQIKVPYRVARR